MKQCNSKEAPNDNPSTDLLQQAYDRYMKEHLCNLKRLKKPRELKKKIDNCTYSISVYKKVCTMIYVQADNKDCLVPLLVINPFSLILRAEAKSYS